jgi:hypothetical protein
MVDYRRIIRNFIFAIVVDLRIYHTCQLPHDLRFVLIYCFMCYTTRVMATVNQHPSVHHERWMINGLETVFCYVPVP